MQQMGQAIFLATQGAVFPLSGAANGLPGGDGCTTAHFDKSTAKIAGYPAEGEKAK